MARELTAYEFLAEHPAVPEKPLPALPALPASPTLTNPDMVLPDRAIGLALASSPPSSRGRPPSPSYLKDDGRNGSRSTTPTPKKEKRGLMSRKMMLLRSRTSSASSLHQQHQQQAVSRSTPFISECAPEDSAYASSPTLMDVGNLAPERPLPSEEKRLSTSGSSFNSEELAGIPSFLAKYESTDGAGTGDELSDSDSTAVAKYGYSVRIEGGNYDAQRRQQEEEEHQSAMLSKRAEQILANAKKRLNVRRTWSYEMQRITDLETAYGREPSWRSRLGRAVDSSESEARDFSRFIRQISLQRTQSICGGRRST